MRAAVFEQIGDYKIIERIGHGGMGEVWLANKVGFAGVTSAFVIKLLHREHASNPKSREYFINEARLAAKLDHPNIVKVIDAGEADNRLYLVMERVDGVNLTSFLRYIRDGGLPLPLDEDITCYIIGEVLTGLVYAHGLTIAGRDAGIIHYDVTPNNILISSSGNVKLTDFGLSRVAAQAQNVSFIAGTPRYMSIEHHTATPRLASDIYGAGVIAHELVSNKRYHDGLEPKQIREAILHGVVHPLGRDDVAPWLVQLITQMLAADYTQRPSARVALEIILRNVPGYRRAAIELARIYKDVVGPARSGMTQFLAAVPEQQQSFLTPPEPRALIPASAATVGPTVSTPPPAATSEPDSPTVSESVTPAVAGSPPDAGQVLTEPTEVLPGFANGRLPADAAQPRADSNSADVVVASTDHPVSARSPRHRALFGVAVVLGTVIFVSLGWVIGTLMGRDDDREPVAALEQKEPEPAAVVAKPDESQAVEASEPAPSAPEPEAVAEPTATQNPPVPEVKEPEPPPESEPVEKAEAEPVEPIKTPTKKEKAPDPVRVILFIKGHDTGTIALGKKEYTLASGTVDIQKLAPGRYPAKWRVSESDSWHGAGTLVIKDIAPATYQFRLSDGTHEQLKPKPGKGQ